MFGSGQGALGEVVKTSWKHLLPLPDALSYDQGAGEFSFVICSCWMEGKEGSSVKGEAEQVVLMNCRVVCYVADVV